MDAGPIVSLTALSCKCIARLLRICAVPSGQNFLRSSFRPYQISLFSHISIVAGRRPLTTWQHCGWDRDSSALEISTIDIPLTAMSKTRRVFFLHKQRYKTNFIQLDEHVETAVFGCRHMLTQSAISYLGGALRVVVSSCDYAIDAFV